MADDLTREEAERLLGASPFASRVRLYEASAM
jgi:hypothetical protein